MDWNVIVTVRRDFDRALGMLRRLGWVERTGLYNVLAMRVPDVRGLLEQIAHLPAAAELFATISHVLPVTHKISFETAEDFAREARGVVLGWAPQLAGKAVQIRVHRRGHKGELHAHELEQRLGGALLDELVRIGAPGRVDFDDPDAVIAIETIRDQAGLALWTRADLERYPFLRAALARGATHGVRPGEAGAPSRALLATATELEARARRDRPATAAEVVGLLGELEPLTIEKLLATGATVAEIAEAVEAIEDEDAFGELHHGPSSPREAEVRAILEALVFEDAEERASDREVVRT